ncbi:MAG: multidrug effflux MFS transporter [Myxococcota bacterium]
MTQSGERAVVPLGFLVLMGSLAAIGPFSIDMYLPALPAVQAHYATDAASVQSTLSSYFLGLAVGQLAFGPLIDRFGRRPPLLFGMVAYVVASIGCAFAPSIGLLVGLRFFQALGACAGVVVSRAVLRDLYSPRDMARVLSLILLIMGIAPIVAPMVGSAVFGALGWPALFVLLAVYGAGLTVAIARFLPETLATPSEALDVRALTVQYLGLFRNRAFLGYALSGGIAQAGMFAYIASSSFVFLQTYALTPTQYSMLFGLNATGLIGAAQLNSWLLRTRSPEQVLEWTLPAFLIAGLALVGAAATGVGGVFGVIVPLFVAMATLGFCFPNTTAAAMGAVKDRVGMASALLGMLQFTLAGMGSAISGQAFDGTALPMALTISGCGIVAYAALRFVTPVGARMAGPAPS